MFGVEKTAAHPTGLGQLQTQITQVATADTAGEARQGGAADFGSQGQVFEAGSGTDGLELLKTQQVDLILSDINMPSMDGLEFLRQLRAQDLAPGVPVVMITTESSEEHVKQAILAGAQGYIRKPFTAEQVKERVLPLLNAA